MLRRLFSIFYADKNHFDSQKIQKFVILSIPRTGSNYLCGMLNSHPDILCHHEVFHPNEIYYSFDHRKGDMCLGTIGQRDRSPKKFIDRMWKLNFGCHAVGFKLLKGQSPKALRLVLKDSRIKKVLLLRRNRIATYVSRMVAVGSNQWSKTSDTEFENQAKIAIDHEAMKREIQENNYFYSNILSYLKESKQKFIEVTYEKLSTEDEKLRLLEYLNVSLSSSIANPFNIKQSHGHLKDRISNFEEVVKQLKRSDLEADLYLP